MPALASLKNQPKSLDCDCGVPFFDLQGFQAHLDAHPSHQPKDKSGLGYIISKLRDTHWRFTKDDVLSVHIILAMIRGELERRGILNDAAFVQYDKFGISAVNVSASRTKQYRAVMLLCAALLESLSPRDDA